MDLVDLAGDTLRLRAVGVGAGVLKGCSVLAAFSSRLQAERNETIPR